VGHVPTGPVPHRGEAACAAPLRLAPSRGFTRWRREGRGGSGAEVISRLFSVRGREGKRGRDPSFHRRSSGARPRRGEVPTAEQRPEAWPPPPPKGRGGPEAASPQGTHRLTTATGREEALWSQSKQRSVPVVALIPGYWRGGS